MILVALVRGGFSPSTSTSLLPTWDMVKEE